MVNVSLLNDTSSFMKQCLMYESNFVLNASNQVTSHLGHFGGKVVRTAGSRPEGRRFESVRLELLIPWPTLNHQVAINH